MPPTTRPGADGAGNKTGQRILIRDRDTDADRVPDAWEYHFFGQPDLGIHVATSMVTVCRTTTRSWFTGPIRAMRTRTRTTSRN
jgi:hypothetical protein